MWIMHTNRAKIKTAFCLVIFDGLFNGFIWILFFGRKFKSYLDLYKF